MHPAKLSLLYKHKFCHSHIQLKSEKRIFIYLFKIFFRIVGTAVHKDLFTVW